MSLSVADFKSEVCALLNRSESAMTVNGQDLILNAMNKAKNTAQIGADFDFLRRLVEVGGPFNSTLFLYGTTMEVAKIKVKKASLYFTGGTVLPCEYQSNEGFLNRLGRRVEYDSCLRIPNSRYIQVEPRKPVVYKTNTATDEGIHIVTYKVWTGDASLVDSLSSGATKIVFDCYVKDQPFTLSGETPEDLIWLDECVTWLQLFVVQFLQTHFVKSTERWPVTEKMVENAWMTLMDWNNGQGQGEIEYDLD